jgi:hypothetical protein
MKKFLAIFRGDANTVAHIEWDKLPKEEQQKRVQQGMEAWGKWMQDNSASIVYSGGPLGKTLAVDREGIKPVKNKDCGYVIIQASTHEDAAKMFLNHPHFSIFPGENVELMECLPIPGSHE